MRDPASLKAQIKIKNWFPKIRAGIGPKTHDFLKKMTVRTLRRTTEGEGRQEQNKSILKYSWGDGTGKTRPG